MAIFTKGDDGFTRDETGYIVVTDKNGVPQWSPTGQPLYAYDGKTGQYYIEAPKVATTNVPSGPSLLETAEKKIRSLNLKSQASKLAKNILSSLKERGVTLLKGLISSLLGEIASVFDLFKSVWDLAISLKNLSISFLLSAEKLKGLALKKYAQQQKLVAKAESLVSSVLPGTLPTADAPQQTVTSDIVGEIMASPSINEVALENASSLYKNKRALENSDSQSIVEQFSVAIDIHKKLPEMGIPEMREWSRSLLHRNSQTDKYVINFELCQPVSEYVASWFKSPTRDKPSLQLHQWHMATTIRPNLAYKLRSYEYNQIEASYKSLNTSFHRCLPNEFWGEPGINVSQAHGYHTVGDFLFADEHLNPISPVYQTINTNIMENLGDKKYMINYLYPVEKNITISQYKATIFAEDYQVPIDGKGNIYRLSLVKSNNDVMKPSKINEY